MRWHQPIRWYSMEGMNRQKKLFVCRLLSDKFIVRSFIITISLWFYHISQQPSSLSEGDLHQWEQQNSENLRIDAPVHLRIPIYSQNDMHAIGWVRNELDNSQSVKSALAPEIAPPAAIAPNWNMIHLKNMLISFPISLQSYSMQLERTRHARSPSMNPLTRMNARTLWAWTLEKKFN